MFTVIVHDTWNLPAIYFHSFFSPLCLSFLHSVLMAACNWLRPPFLLTQLPPSLTHLFIDSHTNTQTHTRSSAPQGSNRGYVSVSLPSPRSHVSLQQVSGQWRRKPRFWGWKRRTKVCMQCQRELDDDRVQILFLEKLQHFKRKVLKT